MSRKLYVSEEAKKAVGVVISREQYRNLKSMNREQLNRWAVDFYAEAYTTGAEVGWDAYEEELKKTAEEEVQIDLDRVIDEIRNTPGVGDILSQRIRKHLCEVFA